MCVCEAQGWGPNLRVSRRWDHCGNHPHLLWRAGNLWGEWEKHRLSSIKTWVTQMTRDNKVFSIQVTVTFTLKAMSHPPALSTPHRPSPDTEWCHWVVGPQSEIEFLSWLIGSLWLRSRSWRRGRMKRENSFMVNGGVRGGGGGVEAGRSLFFRPLKVPDALPVFIMMPYWELRWFRRSNCENTKARWRPREMELCTNTNLQMLVHEHSHMHPHMHLVVQNSLHETSQIDTIWW